MTSEQPAMDREAVRDHWDTWAHAYGEDLRATTRCHSIKTLEIDALQRWLETLGGAEAASILEVGCGNGINGIALTDRNPELRYVGLDYSDAMVESASAAVGQLDDSHAARLHFAAGDVRSLDRDGAPDGPFDFAFTDRMLINLTSAAEQLAAIEAIASQVKPGGHFLMLENSVQSHARLNGLRGSLGLPPRPVAEFNVFIDEETVIAPFAERAELIDVDDFSAIHDLVLYAVQPALGDGEVAYDTPLMEKLTEALVTLNGEEIERRGAFGQNRLWVWRIGEHAQQP